MDRNNRIRRALDISLKRSALPEALSEEPFVQEMMPLLEEAVAEADERKALTGKQEVVAEADERKALT